MVKRTNDLYIVDEGPIIDILEDSSQEIIKEIKQNYIYDKNKGIPRLIFYEEKNLIDSKIYKTLFIISVPCTFIYLIEILTKSFNLFYLICYIILISIISHLIACCFTLLISCIFSNLIQHRIIPLIISRKYK